MLTVLGIIFLMIIVGALCVRFGVSLLRAILALSCLIGLIVLFACFA